MSDDNPLTEMLNYTTGKRIRLNTWIKMETEGLAYDYVEKFGRPPSPIQVINWMRRLKQAYNTGLVVKIEKKK